MNLSSALETALGHYEAGKLQAAQQLCEEILQQQPGRYQALNLLGLIAHRMRRPEEALRNFADALSIEPNSASAHNGIGRILAEQGRIDEAIQHFRISLRLDPAHVQAYCNLARSLAHQGSHQEAVQYFERALSLDPGHLETLLNLGIVHQQLGQLEQARDRYRQVIQLDPGRADAHLYLGTVLNSLGNTQEAKECYEKALAIDPEFAYVHNNLGSLLCDLGMKDEAIRCFRETVRLAPDYFYGHFNLANQLSSQGEFVEAKEFYLRAKRLSPEKKLAELRAETIGPVLFTGNEEIDGFRERLERFLDDFAGIDLRKELGDLSNSMCQPPYQLLVDGRDDLPIRAKYAAVFENRFSRRDPRPQAGLPHLGFVVTEKHEKAFVRSTSGMINRFTPGRFRMTIACAARGRKRIQECVTHPDVEYLDLSQRMERLVQDVAGAQFDLLYHFEVGTDSLNYLLPFFRLAPVQCTSWGVPATSGVPEMDYYISSNLLESESADANYTEKLIRLETLLGCMERIRLTSPSKTRGDFGLGEDRCIYLCAQHIGKFHPEFDTVMAEILRRVPTGVIVLSEQRIKQLAGLLKARFEKSVPDVADRIIFLPTLPLDEYYHLIATSDVLLDPIYHGGALTSYDGLALNKPIVTLPWKYSRGRYTYGCYQKMGVTDCIATDTREYIEIATRLGTEPDARHDVEQKIAEASGVLFEDASAARELQECLLRLIEESRSSAS